MDPKTFLNNQYKKFLIIPGIISIIIFASIFAPIQNNSVQNTISYIQSSYNQQIFNNGFQAGFNEGYKSGYANGFNYSKSMALQEVKNYLSNITANTNASIIQSNYSITYSPTARHFDNFTLNNSPIAILNSSSFDMHIKVNLTVNVCVYNITCQQIPLYKEFNDTINIVLIQVNNNTNFDFDSYYSNRFGNNTLYYPISYSDNTVFPIYYSKLDSTDLFVLIFFDSMVHYYIN